jgi:hypothetical protein
MPQCAPRRGRSGSLRRGRRPGSKRGRSDRLGDPPGSRQVLLASRGRGHVTPDLLGAPRWELRRPPPPFGFVIIPRAAGRADVIVYARRFITIPDFVERFRLEAPLNPWDVRTFYGGDDHGYTDYPTLAEQRWPDPDTAGLRTSVGSPEATSDQSTSVSSDRSRVVARGGFGFGCRDSSFERLRSVSTAHCRSRRLKRRSWRSPPASMREACVFFNNDPRQS